MLESWNPLGLTVPNKKPRNKTIVDGILNAAEYSGVDTTGLHTLLKAMSPRMSKVDNAQVSFYENSVKCVADNLTRTTPARFLRRIIPTVSNTMAEAFALFWKNNVSHNPKDYVLYVGNTRKDFKQSFVNVCCRQEFPPARAGR